MKKSKLFTILLCIIMLFACVGCGSVSSGVISNNKAPLIYNKKYYHADYVIRDSLETNKRYIIFYSDGTGEYSEDGYDGTVEFKYILTEDSVHCFYDGGYNGNIDGTKWNRWWQVDDGLLYQSAYLDTQYINETYLDKIPNFGK